MGRWKWWRFGRGNNEAEKETARAVTAWAARALRSPMAGADPLSRELGYQIYDRMQADAQVRASLNLKKLGVLAAPWRIEPADGSPRAAEAAQFAQLCLSQMRGSVSGLLWKAMDAFAKGFSVLELVYETRRQPPFEGKLALKLVKAKDPERFGFEVDEFLNVKSLVLNTPGEREQALPREKFAIYIYNPRYESPWGEPDLRAAYPHWFIKSHLLKFWSTYLEKHGSPTIVGQYQRSLSPESQDALLRTLEQLQQESAIVIPEEVEVRLLEAAQGGATGYLEAVEYHNKEIARAILGQTLTTDEGRRVGSLALGAVHFQVMLLQLQALRRDLAETVVTEQVLRPLTELNFGPGVCPGFVFAETPLQGFVTGDLGTSVTGET